MKTRGCKVLETFLSFMSNSSSCTLTCGTGGLAGSSAIHERAREALVLALARALVYRARAS